MGAGGGGMAPQVSQGQWSGGGGPVGGIIACEVRDGAGGKEVHDRGLAHEEAALRDRSVRDRGRGRRGKGGGGVGAK